MLSSRAARSEKAITRSPDLRESILDCARRILLRGGVDQITARKIASAAGCSATAIYFHYENLDDVLFALRMEGHEVVAAGIGNGDIVRRSDPMVVTNAIWAQIHGVTSLAVQRLLVHTSPRGNEEVLEE